MRVDLGIFAHDEGATIGRMVAGVLAQDRGGLDLRVLVLANGCTDDTAARARAAGAEVADLPEGGKAAPGTASSMISRALMPRC
ncbi:hypothetical protein ACFSHQ_04575 [Gemmobacter lanyuensis]